MSRRSSKPRSVIVIDDTPPASVIRSANAAKPNQATVFSHVSLPQLSAERKAQYKPVKESSLFPKIDEVIGEYEQDGNLWYFARFKGGIAHRYPAESFESNFPSLLETYKRKQAEGTLDPFDPTASYIHPLERVVLKANLPSRSESTLSSLSVATPSSSDEDEVDEEYDDDDSSVRRPTRRSARIYKDLPFSPKKTRRVVLTVTDDDDEGSSTRRSLRSRRLKLKPMVYDDEDYGESEVNSDDDEYTRGRRGSRGKSVKGKQKAGARPRGARPEYGAVKSIEDIDLDYFSDDEDRPLRAHRGICEKCHLQPANLQLAAWKKRKGRKKKTNSDEETDDEERIERLGGWVRCLKCCVSAHWGCMAQTQRDEVLKAIREREIAKWKEQHGDEGDPPRRKEVGIQETTDFICGPCSRGGICMGCMETVLKPLGDAPVSALARVQKDGEDITMADASQQPFQEESPESATIVPSRELLYRCLTCKRLSHYAHLRRPTPLPSDASLPEIAEYYQIDTSWLCADCTSFRYPLDKIIAWRPYPPTATEPIRPKDQPPPYKERLPREYLVKWQDRSYRRLSWVPHMWLVSTNPSKLKNFLSGGTKVELLTEPVNDEEKDSSGEVAFEIAAGAEESRASSVKPGAGAVTAKLPSDALPDAERWIPPAWKTVDRVLDVVLWMPKKPTAVGKKSLKNNKKQVVVTDDEENEEEEGSVEMGEELEEIKKKIFEEGELPSLENTETAEQWEERTGQTISMKQMKKVVWAFIKWDDLGYDEASWDSPPRPGEKGYDAYTSAFKRFVFSRTVEVPKLSATHAKQFDDRAKDGFMKKYYLKDAATLQLGQAPGLKLMPFQVDGFNWLCNNWWNHQQCILADEMGLGKTVQVTAFLGFIAQKWKAFPALVVVPNSTITNWVREFERWAPNLRVVPFYGEKKARDVIKKFELVHKNYLTTNTPAKFHVLVTTYENITGKDFTTVFKNQNRWEVLVVDEGQRLKSDSSLLFRKLNELRSIHRVIMTGTPLNNNIRELFNLMNFLDPEEWADLEGLEKEYTELDEESIKTLHNRLRPYFLRRIKSEVLQLPAKNEVIVPVSMTPLQKEVVRSIMSHNFNLLSGLARNNLGSAHKGKLNNVLMHVRKCLQHPYLYSEDIEPRGLDQRETHEKLIDASGKLRLLRPLLSKLKERGHRVLLFSQFVLALNIIEDFLTGEGFKYLRLDGSTKGTERQKGMDEFNKPGSDIFIYLLTTRAGGVGINLFSADTVIIFDPDFNPHQDLQAIARAYRYGQKKTCLVFKLMVKDSSEERIMQIGKKKLVLDHLIVQKMGDDDDGAGENIQSILTYGAQALYEEEGEGEKSRGITYSDQDILKLIERTEVTGEEEDKPKEGMNFSFAKVWAADKDSLEEIEEDDRVDSWTLALEKIQAEQIKEAIKVEAESGRGRRKAAAAAKKKMGANDVPDGLEQRPRPKKGKKPAKSDGSGSAYTASDNEESIDESSDVVMGDAVPDDDDLEELRRQVQRKTLQDRNSSPGYVPAPPRPHPPKPAVPEYPECGLCGGRHGDGFGECPMTDKSENLAEYREILILHADDEDWETRAGSAAIKLIDEVLYSRGHLSLIAGQPLHPIKPQPQVARPVIPKPTLVNNPIQTQRIAQPPPVPQRYIPQPTQIQAYQTIQAPSSASSSQPIISNTTSNLIYPPLPPGPSKRPYSPTGEPAKKKPKVPENKCPVCNVSPPHLIKDCGVVRAGPKSISQQVERLEQDPTMRDVVNILRNILRKMKAREMELQMQ